MKDSRLIALIVVGLVAVLAATLITPSNPSNPGLESSTTGGTSASEAVPSRSSVAKSRQEAGSRRSSQQSDAIAPMGSLDVAGPISLRVRALDARSGRPVLAVLTMGLAKFPGNLDGVIEADFNPSIANGPIDLLSDLVVAAPGYRAAKLTIPEAAGPQVDLGTIGLNPGMILAVNVKDAGGLPVQGAPITILSPGVGTPVWRSWTAGRTDTEGELRLHALPGELVYASHSRGNSSATAQVTTSDRVLELVLKDDFGLRLGLLDRTTGSPLPAISVELRSESAYPRFNWSGQSGDEGVLPIPLPPRQVVLRIPPPFQLVDESGLPVDSLAIDPRKLNVQAGGGFRSDGSSRAGGDLQDEGVTWIEVSRDSGPWFHFVDALEGETIRDGVVEVYRDSERPDGSFQALRVETRRLEDGLLRVAPYFTADFEPLYAIVRAPGFRPFDTRRVPEPSQGGATKTIPLEPAELGALRLVHPEGCPVRMRVWFFSGNFDTAIFASSTDSDGLVHGIPRTSGSVYVCSAPSRASAFGEVEPGDLFHTPPLELIAPSFARLIVEYAPDVSPDESLQAVDSGGRPIVPVIEQNSAVFDNLVPGRYSLGTSRQHAAERKRREPALDSAASRPSSLVLRPGQELRVQAADGWGREEGGSNRVSGTVHMEGPRSGVVMPLYDRRPGPLILAIPRFVARIDASGRFECPGGPDLAGLATGTIDQETGDFIPLSVFPVENPNIVAKGARLVVRAAESVKGSVFMQLRLHPVGFSVQGSIVRGLEAGGRADFGWVPLGEHDLTILGGTATSLTIGEAGEAEYVLSQDGSLVLGD